MRAVVYDPSQPQQLAFAELPDPVPTSSRALIDGYATSLNFGEPEDLAAAIELLMTNPYVTASTLQVDGGFTAI